MSGGAFNYKCFAFREFADMAEGELEEQVFDGLPFEVSWPVRVALKRIRSAGKLAHAIEWYFSGDIGSEELLRRLERVLPQDKPEDEEEIGMNKKEIKVGLVEWGTYEREVARRLTFEAFAKVLDGLLWELVKDNTDEEKVDIAYLINKSAASVMPDKYELVTTVKPPSPQDKPDDDADARPNDDA